MSRLLAVLLCTLLIIPVSVAWHLALYTNVRECVLYDVDILGATATMEVSYNLRETMDGTITATVEQVTGGKVIMNEVLSMTERGAFSFETEVPGLHRVCFFFSGGLPHARATLSVRLDRDVSFEDRQPSRENAPTAMAARILQHEEAANKDSVLISAATSEAYTARLESVTAALKLCEKEMDALVERQLQFERTVNSTHFRVVAFTLLNLVVMLGVGFWQTTHFKKFFREKKVV